MVNFTSLIVGPQISIAINGALIRAIAVIALFGRD